MPDPQSDPTQIRWDAELSDALQMAKLGRLGDAASRFRTLLQQARQNFGEADFRSLESARALAECLWELGEYAQSESIPERLLSLPPTAQARLTAGRILRYQENNERAAEVLAQGASAFPGDSDFSYELGLVQDRSGYFEDAIRSLSRARTLSPEKNTYGARSLEACSMQAVSRTSSLSARPRRPAAHPHPNWTCNGVSP